MPPKIEVDISKRRVVTLYKGGIHSIRDIARKLHVNTDEGKATVRKMLESSAIYMRRFFNEEEKEIIRKRYPHVETNIVLRELKRKGYKRTISAIHQMAAKLGVVKTDECHEKIISKYAQRLENAGRKTRFKEGRVSWNDGLKGWQLKANLSQQAWENLKRGQFKKGHKSVRWTGYHDGIVKIIREKSGRLYKRIRLAPGKWEYYHRFKWKMLRGRIPKGKIVVFKNFNSLDCSIANLMLVTRQEHGQRWSLTDGAIARTLAVQHGGRGIIDRKLYDQFLNKPVLIQAKRKQLELQRSINAAA